MNKEPISLHTFLFPFKWEIKQKEDTTLLSLEERTDLLSVERLLPEQYWSRFKFKPEADGNFNTYNEYAYFYEHIRDVLHLDPQQSFISGRQFVYKGVEHAKYNIQLIEGLKFALEIREITLNFLESGVGVLSFHLTNYDVEDFNHILKINEYGRRIFPQFLGDNGRLTTATKYSFLAHEISLEELPMANMLLSKEDFSYYDEYVNIQNQPFRLPNFISGLLGSHFKGSFKEASCHDAIITPVIDDRMYVMCLYYNAGLLDQLKKYNAATEEYAYLKSDEWYRFLFIDDRSPTCKSIPMKKRLLLNQTYDRWIDNEKEGENIAQLFGISRYSFVCIAAGGYYNKEILINHFSAQYFQILLYGLFQRSYVINFSAEIARITHRLKRKAETSNKDRADIGKLYLSYIKFVNRIHFREITPQEQGIELYDLLLKTFRLPEHIADLKDEVSELNNYVEMARQTDLNRMAAGFLPLSILASILAIEVLKDFSTMQFATGKDIDFMFTIRVVGTLFLIIASVYVGLKNFKLLKR
ncbi:MAG: hypothetical protein U0T84_07955 [Chitinophagales bacterium]